MRAPVRFCRRQWAEEDERADRTLGIAQSRPRTPDGVGYTLQRRILADHALAQPLFHVDQFLDFAFEHLGNGNARPLGDDARDIFFIHFLFEHALPGLAVDLGRELAQFGLQARYLAVLNLGGAVVVAFADRRPAHRS